MLEKEANRISGLNDREIEILFLLSAGHTAKSIAALTGLSVNAVNDRLRDARRKSGVGSSRELARLIAAQENCPEKVELSHSNGETQERQDVRAPIGVPNSRKGKIMALSLAGLALIVAIGGYRQGGTRPSGHVDHDAALRLSEEGNVNQRGLAAALDLEGRDPLWASQTEALLRRAYGSVLVRQGLGTGPSVRCGRTLCEVLGIYSAAASPEGELTLRRALMPAAFPTLANAGLASRGSSISSKSGATPKLTIVAYWQAPAQR